MRPRRRLAINVERPIRSIEAHKNPLHIRTQKDFQTIQARKTDEGNPRTLTQTTRAFGFYTAAARFKKKPMRRFHAHTIAAATLAAISTPAAFAQDKGNLSIYCSMQIE